MRQSIREEEREGDVLVRDYRQELISGIINDIRFFAALLATYDGESPRLHELRFDTVPLRDDRPIDVRKELRENIRLLKSRLEGLQGCNG